VRCANRRARHHAKDLYDSEVLNEMYGGRILKPNTKICKSCIPHYFEGLTYEQLKMRIGEVPKPKAAGATISGVTVWTRHKSGAVLPSARREAITLADENSGTLRDGRPVVRHQGIWVFEEIAE